MVHLDIGIQKIMVVVHTNIILEDFKQVVQKHQLTIDVGATLVNWKATTDDSVAAAVLFKSSASGSGNRGGAGAFSRARLFDPSETTSNLISSSVAHQSDDHLNPFTDQLIYLEILVVVYQVQIIQYHLEMQMVCF